MSESFGDIPQSISPDDPELIWPIVKEKARLEILFNFLKRERELHRGNWSIQTVRQIIGENLGDANKELSKNAFKNTGYSSNKVGVPRRRQESLDEVLNILTEVMYSHNLPTDISVDELIDILEEKLSYINKSSQK